MEQTQKWVGLTFFGSMLKQMRNSPFKSEIFDGGRGGEAFGSMFDQQIAERMSRGSGAKLVNAIVKKIEANKAYSKQGINGAKKPAGAATSAGNAAARDGGQKDAGSGTSNGGAGNGGPDFRGQSWRRGEMSPIPKVRTDVPTNLRA